MAVVAQMETGESGNDGAGRATAGIQISDELRGFFRAVGKGWRVLSRDQRVLNGKLYAKQARLKKLELYGPTGQRTIPYEEWCRAHGYEHKLNSVQGGLDNQLSQDKSKL